MKKTLLLAFAATLLLDVAQGQTVSSVINYQGRVTDSTGMPVGATGTPSAPVASPVNRKVRFRLYDASTAGTRKYSEEQTVTISLGEFSVLVGQGTPIAGETNPGGGLPTVFMDLTGTSANRYIGITVDNGDGTFNASDFEITPRQQITSTGFSFRSKVAESLATGTLASGAAPVHLVGGGANVTNSRLAVLQANGATDSVSMQFRDATAERSIIGLAGADTLFSSSALTGDTVFRTGGGNKLHLQNGAGAAALTVSGNNVGIGNANPAAKLSVVGNTLQLETSAYGNLLNTAGDARIYLGRTAASNVASLVLRDGGAAKGEFGLMGDGLIHLKTASGAAGSETYLSRMAVDSGGNFGINNTAPEVKLHIGNYSAGDQSIRISTAGGNVNRSSLDLRHFNGGNGFSLVSDERTTLGLGFHIMDYTNATAASRLHIDKNGNTGVGTTAPGARLDVSNGTTHLQIRPGELNGVADANASTLEIPGNGTVGIWDSLRVFANTTVDGYIGIGTGTTSPGCRLHIKAPFDNSRDSGIRLEHAGDTDRWNIHPENTANALIFSFNNQYAGGPYCYLNATQAGLITVSDRRSKKDILPVTGSLAKVMALRPSSYRYKIAGAGSRKNFGFIAQEVEPVLPDIVLEHNGLKTLATEGLISINTQAIQELKQEKDAEIKVRDEKIAALEARLARLEKALTGGESSPPAATKKVAAARPVRR